MRTVEAPEMSFEIDKPQQIGVENKEKTTFYHSLKFPCSFHCLNSIFKDCEEVLIVSI